MVETADGGPGTVAEIVEELRRIVADDLDVHLLREEIDPDASLLDGEVAIDSIAIVDLIAIVEERFAIELDDADLVPASFASLRVLAELIAARSAPVRG